ncbi:2-oxo acid dehydrogenase subunit E2 [Parasphingorhabdus sp.]|uniref:2-oxo acid dehydrogenase subunit E2 n=1 Tax=Parasphingorhabdus sp. TaxID=2709688 RepID=UPI003A907833
MNATEILGSLPPWPEVDFSEFGEVEAQPLSRMQKLAGGFLARNWVAIPHVTHHDDADITRMEERRRVHNADNPAAKLTPPALIAKALIAALKQFPQFNASIDQKTGALILKKYYNIGFAVETPGGLLVPVVTNCDTKPAVEIGAELAALATKAREKGLSTAEMSGGCMTITSLGHIGGTGFTPIINAPEVAILGVTQARRLPTPGPYGDIVWRKMLPLSLSYDHRVINGADAARFVNCVAEQLDGEEIFS